jgi:hypothetical protein
MWPLKARTPIIEALFYILQAAKKYCVVMGLWTLSIVRRVKY